MPLPPRFAWTVDEAAARLDRAPADVIGYAIQGKLELVASLPPWETAAGDGFGLTVIPPEAVLTMFRRDGAGPRHAMVFHVGKPDAGGDWHRLTNPAEGIRIERADLLVTAAQLDRFEEDHDLRKRPCARGGSSAIWDWEAFWIAVIRRVHNHGLPENQRALTLEMQEWFARRSPDGGSPDESTIGKKIREVWKALREDE